MAQQHHSDHQTNATQSMTNKPRYLASVLSLIALSSVEFVVPSSAKDKILQFWNLTENTLTELYFAPSGTGKWGENQCLNDKDKTVETDELVKLEHVSPGLYDIKFKDERGRICVVRHVQVTANDAVSIREKELKDCTN